MPSSFSHKMKVLFSAGDLAVAGGQRWEEPVGWSQGTHVYTHCTTTLEFLHSMGKASCKPSETPNCKLSLKFQSADSRTSES